MSAFALPENEHFSQFAPHLEAQHERQGAASDRGPAINGLFAARLVRSALTVHAGAEAAANGTAVAH